MQRGTLVQDLKGTLEKDELHLIHLLLDDVQISVKLENETGKLFKSLIRSPQEDAASALITLFGSDKTLSYRK